MKFVRRQMLQFARAASLRHLSRALGVSCLLVVQPALAQDNAANLYGVWKLKSDVVQIAGENTPPFAVWGPNPKGNLILLPNGCMMAHISAPDRQPAKNDADRAALLQSMVAYTGTYTIEGDKWTTTVDLSHNEILTRQPQVRYFRVDGDKLYVRTPEQENSLASGRKTGNC